MTRIEVSTSRGDSIAGRGETTGYGTSVARQRRVELTVGWTTVVVFVHGDDETRALFRALAGASGGLLATLPEPDESSLQTEVADAVANVEG